MDRCDPRASWLGVVQNTLPPARGMRCSFDVSSDCGLERLLYLACVCFGNLTKRVAARLKPGDRIFAAGKPVTSRYGQALSFDVNNFELTHAPLPCSH